MQQRSRYGQKPLKAAISWLLWMALSSNLQAQIAAGECKFLGNILGASTPADFTQYWNQVTPENAGKWGSVEASRDVMNWTALDNIYNFAREHNFPFRQHTLVWGQQQPSWLSSLTMQEQREEVEEWISAFCERYPDTDFIDVVNEPLHAQPSYKEAIGGNGLTGWDWVIWTFQTTRNYCPEAELFLNDYNIISSDGATTNYLKIVNLLQAEDLIDGVGEQGHFLEAADITTINDNLWRFHETGLPVHITELDIDHSGDSEQSSLYQSIFPKLWNHPAVEGITLWGYTEGEIWREDAYLLRDDGSARPAFTWLQGYVGDISQGVSCSPVGAEDELNETFNIFPNPSSGGLISVNTPLGVFELQLTDMTGNCLVKTTTDFAGRHVLDVKLASGVYLLSLRSDQTLLTRKLIVL